MNPKPKSFEFLSYAIEGDRRTLSFSYRLDFDDQDPVIFREEIILPKAIPSDDQASNFLAHILPSIHLVLGISYYKLYCPEKIILPYALSEEQSQFWTELYRKGLGEFLYRNNLPLTRIPSFQSSNVQRTSYIVLSTHQPALVPTANKVLLGIGGGKDSIVAGELLREIGVITTAFVVETQRRSDIASGVIKMMNLDSLTVTRLLDPQIFESHPGSFNGHVPISAIIAFLGVLTAGLNGFGFVAVANEFSSNFGNLKYKGVNINHQWSKSMEFESMFQEYVRKYITPDVVYFSPMRPFYEIRIVKEFARFKKYLPYFTSCNRSFTVHKERGTSLWCGECPKCTFMFLLLASVLPKAEVIKLFGRNLLNDERLLPMYRDLLGFGSLKPFDCVGTFEESRAALFLIKEKFSESLVVSRFISKITNGKELVEMVFRTNASPTVPARFITLGMKSVLLLGYGKEGLVTEKYFKKFYPKLKIGIADQKKNPKYLELQSKYDLIIKTPGIPKTLVAAHYTTASNLFFAQYRDRIIGVTGTKGKSTTTTLIYEMLKAGGVKVALLGNVGTPMLSAMMKKDDGKTWYIVELSSYMLDDLQFSPAIALAINLFPEHMNYHGTLEKYYLAKMNIVNRQKPGDLFVYNQNNPRLRSWSKLTPAESIGFAEIKDFASYRSKLLGEHNLDNIRAAITVARHFNLSEEAIKKALRSFKSLPHRLEEIGTYRGIKFFDDAISTTPESTMMALKTLPKVATIFLGGEDRGYDFDLLFKTLKTLKVKNIVLFPDSGKRILKSRKGFDVLETRSMKEAVDFAYKVTPKGSICLLSTASPSYSVWENFEEKGDLFVKYVKELGRSRKDKV